MACLIILHNWFATSSRGFVVALWQASALVLPILKDTLYPDNFNYFVRLIILIKASDIEFINTSIGNLLLYNVCLLFITIDNMPFYFHSSSLTHWSIH